MNNLLKYPNKVQKKNIKADILRLLNMSSTQLNILCQLQLDFTYSKSAKSIYSNLQLKYMELFISK